MTVHSAAEGRHAGSSEPRPGRSLGNLWRSRSLRFLVAGSVVVNVIVLLLAGRPAMFDRPLLEPATYREQLLGGDGAILEVLVLFGVAALLMRRRVSPDLPARAIPRAAAARETATIVTYGILGQLGGVALGQALGWHGFSFHLTGTLYGTHQTVERAEAIVWSLYNGVVYALIPFLYFRRRYTARQLNLRSTDRRNDALVIGVILILESAAQLIAFNGAILDLSPRQLLLGAPLSFALYFVGTVLPTMIFIMCLLVPRYLALTGSTVTTVVLGGLTYAALHAYDGWMAFGNAADTVLSVCFLLLLYVGPGMFKTFLTVRTGNAWVHVWAYHAIAPHVLEDAPHIVEVFRIR